MISKTKVLIVDDSEAMCQFLTQVLSSDPEIRVVGHALDPYQARDMIKLLQPDVLTLDIEMPKMDGITFLRNIMRLKPMPVVMLSSLTAAGAAITLEALSIGAVDFLVKRHPGGEAELKDYISNIIAVVKGAAKAKLRGPSRARKAATLNPNFKYWKNKFKRSEPINLELSRVIAIGASTGGPEAISEVLENLNAPECAVVISQHMPMQFMPSFAARLNQLSSLNFSEALHDSELRPGCGYLAPGDRHLEFRKIGTKVLTVVSDDKKRNRHRPSVDNMFESLSEVCPLSSLAILLTGMGIDGAAGMKKMRQAGALTFVQDEASSAVWGMPGAAKNVGAADGVLSLNEIAPTIEHFLRSPCYSGL